MAETVNVKNIGLRGVTVADTRVSFIDGQQGILIYRGYRIEELAKHSSFMEVSFLLLHGKLPSPEELRTFEVEVGKARELPDFIFDCFRKYPPRAHPMDVLQASVPLLSMLDPDCGDDSREANVRMAIRLIARLPALAAAWHRIRNCLAPLPPDPDLPHAANFLWQLHGERPEKRAAHDLDVCLILHADHTFNASTFACREVVSTRAHMYAGVAAGIGALSGPLHGGANARVMEMLMALEGETDIPGWVKKTIDRGEKIMGMGHAVYKTYDPRARILREMALRLGKDEADGLLLRATSLEEAAMAEFSHRGKPFIQPNVDFFSSLVYRTLAIPVDLMTPVFSIARIAGWCAHIIEEKTGEAQEKPTLYRPKAEYVGHYCGLMGCNYTPLDKR